MIGMSIVISATTSSDSRASYSNLGSCVDVFAPGSSITSAWHTSNTATNTISGTSMASPHVAGAAALLLQSAPNLPSQAVAAALQNSAVPKPWSGNPGLGFLDLVHRQGAGMLRIDDAITTATRVAPGKLSLGESEAGPAAHSVTLRNTGVVTLNSAVTIDRFTIMGATSQLTIASGGSLNSLMAVVAPMLGAPLLAMVSHLTQGDWRIGAPFFFCAVLQVASLALAVMHLRRHRRRQDPPQ